ncbi:cytochrome d ubiquinol oxidase subunit II [Trueperella sp. LYQ141]|uniref:cytochrome d ubiquinol oxidase subunit II n=1 Tax=Trueperella sp. LYQ141 TaxID=3391058 RepID=UPI003983ACF1
MELSFLQLIWFVLIIVLWIGYLTLEGFGFGAGILLKVLPRNEKERRLLLNTIGPHWDGNEVFLLTAGGATFAAFPAWYATMFSGMYTALVLVLVLLILRISALEWRGKINSDRWRAVWDNLHFISAALASVVWGVAFGNLVQGMKIEVGSYATYGAGDFQAVDPSTVETAVAHGAKHYMTGGFFSLFTPFTILAGVVVLLLFLSHGALWLTIKTKGDFRTRALALAKKITVAATGVTAVWALWAQLAYSDAMWGWIALLLTAGALITTCLMTLKEKDIAAFFCSFGALAMAVVFIFSTFGANALKSSINSAYNLTLIQASATAPTHTVMLIAAIIFVPIVAVYMIWSYLAFSSRLSAENMSDRPSGLDPKRIREFAAA